MKVLAGSANPRFARSLADALGTTVLASEFKEFPDGEVYVRLGEDVRGEHVVLVQSTHPAAKFVEMLLLQDAARGGGAASISAVVPYYAYARQDQAFKSGEVVSAKALADVLELKVDRVITVDPHKEHILGFFSIEAHGVSAIPEIAAHLASQKPDLILAPDKGALARAAECAKLLRIPSDYLEKTRLSGTEVEMKPKDLDVAGKRVVIIDDIISTGGTIASAATALKAQGAARVSAACTHGLFAPGAVERLRNSGCDDVIACDTLEGAASAVSAAPAVARLLKSLPVARAAVANR